MNASYLTQLNELVSDLLKNKTVMKSISYLKKKITLGNEPFVWAALEPADLPKQLPGKLKSGWIFVLKKGVPSGLRMTCVCLTRFIREDTLDFKM